MKTLVEYIHEAVKLNEAKDSKSISFNFSGLNDIEDFLKSFDSYDCVEVEDNTVKVNVTNSDDCAKVFELIQDFVHARRNDQKVASDEAYAQKVHKLEDKLSEWQDFLDDLELDEDDDKDDDKGDDSKEDDKCPKCGKNPCECDKKEEE